MRDQHLLRGAGLAQHDPNFGGVPVFGILKNLDHALIRVDVSSLCGVTCAFEGVLKEKRRVREKSITLADVFRCEDWIARIGWKALLVLRENFLRCDPSERAESLYFCSILVRRQSCHSRSYTRPLERNRLGIWDQ